MIDNCFAIGSNTVYRLLVITLGSKKARFNNKMLQDRDAKNMVRNRVIIT